MKEFQCTQGLPRWLSGKKIYLPTQEKQEAWVPSLSQEDPLEEEMATHSGILAWKIPWTEEPGRPQAMQSQRVEHHDEHACTQCIQLTTYSCLHPNIVASAPPILMKLLFGLYREYYSLTSLLHLPLLTNLKIHLLYSQLCFCS